MPLRDDVPGVGVDNLVLQEAISMYSDEAYTNAKKLSGTGIMGTNDDIDKDTETFIGQIRWRTNINPTINVASLTDSSDGVKSTYGSNYLRYVKTVRTHGAEKVNMAKVVSQEDGLAKFGRDFAETQTQDEHNAIMAILKGVATAEALYGAASGSGNAGLGGQTFENDPTSKRYGFYVDLGANKAVVDSSPSVQGAQRAEGFLNAIGMAWKDYEPEYCYLVTSPAVMASLRSANLVDQDKVRDGEVEFNTIYDGKFRLLLTRANQSFNAAELAKLNTGAGVDIVGTKTSFIVLPGAMAMETLDVPDRVEITRDGNAYKGGGKTDIWYRWGYVMAPGGYDWTGDEDDFPSDAQYAAVDDDGTGTNPRVALTAATDGLANATGTWNRKFSSALSLGILPVFHS